jgi:hypothetical protein
MCPGDAAVAGRSDEKEMRKMDGMGVSRPWPGAVLRRVLAPTALAAVVVTLSGSTAGIAAPSPSYYQVPPRPSAIGPAFVTWLTVSPAYRHTGLVAATGTLTKCSKNCIALWISHDGGHAWHRAAAEGWQPSRLAIGVDAHGRDVLYGEGGRFLMRSTDGGETFQPAGGGSVPTVLPGYAADGSLAVAAAGQGPDYVIQGGAAHDVAGSRDQDVDLQFVTAPTYPNGGSFSPALLAAMDPNTQKPLVLRCAADLACASPTVIPQAVTSWSMTTVATLLYVSDDYAESGAVFADTPVGVSKSLDGGATFTPLNVVPTGGADRTATPAMALAPGYREAGPVRTAFVSVYQAFGVGTRQAHTAGGIYVTSDGGTTWKGLATTGAFAGGSQAVAVAPDGRLFASYTDEYGNDGLLCSTDNGASWQVSCPAVGDAASTAASGASRSGGHPCGVPSCPGTSGAPGGGGTGPAPATPGNSASGSSVDSTTALASTGAQGSGARRWLIAVVAAVIVLAGTAWAWRGRRRARQRHSGPAGS